MGVTKKVKSWWNNPYGAPLTEPLRMIGRAAVAPITGFIQAIRKGMEDEEYSYSGADKNKPKLARIFKEMADADSGFAVFMASTFGAAIAGIAGGIGAGIGIHSMGYGALAIGAGSLVAAAASAIAFPFAVMGALAFAGAAIGAIASPWGFGKGVIKAARHYQFQKTQAAVVQAAPALQAALPEAQETATHIFSQLRALPEALRAPVLKSLAEQFAATGDGAADSIMKSIEALPDADRTALVSEIRKKIAPVFDAVATAEAQGAMTLQAEALTMAPLKFKHK